MKKRVTIKAQQPIKKIIAISAIILTIILAVYIKTAPDESAVPAFAAYAEQSREKNTGFMDIFEMR